MKSILQIKQEFFYQQKNIPSFVIKEWLLWVIHQNETFLIANEDYVLTKKQYQDFLEGIDKLQKNIPLAYIVGKQEFWGRDFLVNKHTLIPRPDSERMIDLVLDFVKTQELITPKILDLGTGSGCLAITLAKELPKSQVMAVDFCLDALDIAIKNAKKLQANNCQFISSNWFDGITDKFDIIVSNPPYIAFDDQHLKDLIAEPITALAAKDEGFADIYHIIKNAKNYLYDNGVLFIEHGFDQAKKVQDIFFEWGFIDIKTTKDYGGNDRITQGMYNENIRR